jgi:hypothetical protein
LNGYEVASELNSEGCEVFEYSIIQGWLKLIVGQNAFSRLYAIRLFWGHI